MTDASTLKNAISRIDFARRYALDLIKDVPDSEWFRQPHEGVTHLAWQIAHLAVAEFALAIGRLREETPADQELLPLAFRTQFGKGSFPDPHPQNNPTPAEIRRIAAAVHGQILSELPNYSPDSLDATTLKPHPLFTTKIGALLWCSDHELIHCGQIALLRRLLGRSPLR